MTLGGAEPEPSAAPRRATNPAPRAPAPSMPTSAAAAAIRAVAALIFFGFATLFFIGAALFLVGVLQDKSAEFSPIAFGVAVVAAFTWFRALRGLARSLGGVTA